MFWWGILTLLNSDALFNNHIYFKSLLEITSQHTWGLIAAVLGAIRIVFLIINGAWRPSAHIRALGSIVGSFLWAVLSLATLSMDWVTPNMVFFTAFLAFDLYSLWFSAEDAKLADLAQKKK
jgi:hypothetical protein